MSRIEKVTPAIMGALVDSQVDQPTLVRDTDGSLVIVPFSQNRGRPVIATRQEYMDYCCGTDDEWMRVSFASDANTYG